MEHLEIPAASKIVSKLQREYQVEVLVDWDSNRKGEWRNGEWSLVELEKLVNSINILASAMGGADRFIQNLGGVKVQKLDMGSHGGEALIHQVNLSSQGTFSTWTVVHEMAHAWDANYHWALSVLLEKYTGGFTNLLLSRVKRFFGKWDAGFSGKGNKPGGQGRLRGCNASGYFYGDKPSGSNWDFNRKEDFAESIAMYLGWKKNNALSNWAEGRINRYLRENGTRDNNFGADNWADYAIYFYPDAGDYTKTKRWKFVDELMCGTLKLKNNSQAAPIEIINT